MARSATPAEIALNVIQSEAKNLDDTHVYVSEILRFALDDIENQTASACSSASFIVPFRGLEISSKEYR